MCSSDLYQGGNTSSNNALPAIISYNGTGPNGSDAITLVTMDPGLEMYTNFSQPQPCGANEISFDPGIFNNRAKIGQLAAGEMLMCMDYASITQYRSFLWQITAADSSTGIVTVTPNDSAYVDFDAQCTNNQIGRAHV